MYLTIDCQISFKIPLLLIPSNAYFLSVSYYPLPQFLLSVPVSWSYFKSYSISMLVKYLRLWTVSADNQEGLAILKLLVYKTNTSCLTYILCHSEDRVGNCLVSGQRQAFLTRKHGHIVSRYSFSSRIQ